MINLLPENKKKLIEKEYKFRVLVLAFVFVLTAFVVALILLLPSYFLAIYREQAAVSKAAVVQTPEDTKDRETLDQTLQSVKVMTTVLAPDKNVVLPSEIISLITNNKTSGIHISEIVYENTKNAEQSFFLTVRGTADTRQSLLSFVTALKREKKIGSLDLPVSNFAKDTDIEFSFQIKGAL